MTFYVFQILVHGILILKLSLKNTFLVLKVVIHSLAFRGNRTVTVLSMEMDKIFKIFPDMLT